MGEETKKKRKKIKKDKKKKKDEESAGEKQKVTATSAEKETPTRLTEPRDVTMGRGSAPDLTDGRHSAVSLVPYDSQEEELNGRLQEVGPVDQQTDAVHHTGGAGSKTTTLTAAEKPEVQLELEKVTPTEEAEALRHKQSFKNSFSEVQQEVKPAVVLPTLVFDRKTTELKAKVPQDDVNKDRRSSKAQRRQERKAASKTSLSPSPSPPRQSHSKSTSSNTSPINKAAPPRVESASSVPVAESSPMNGDTATSRRRREDEKESVTAGITDISDLALQSSKNQRDSHEDKSRKFSTKDSSPLQLPEDKRLSARDMTPELELSLSPTNVSPFSVELNKSSHEYYLPDNPLVKSDMDPDYKDELDILKSQLQMQKRELSEEDSKLKMAEADSTIDSLHLQDNGWECEIPGSRLEKTSGQPSTLLSKAIGNIKENDNLKRKSRDREEHLSDDGELIKKKKKKKRKEETDS